MSEEKCEFYNGHSELAQGQLAQPSCKLALVSDDKHYYWDCDDNPNCYFKQLLAAKEENKQLIGDMANQMYKMDESSDLLQKTKEKKSFWEHRFDESEQDSQKIIQQNEKMRETLERIKDNKCIGCDLYVTHLDICGADKSYEPNGKQHKEICWEHCTNKLLKVQRLAQQAVKGVE